MSTKTNTAQASHLAPIFVDCFAGGGGWSVGFELATSKIIDIAINHDPDAILMHRTNHPYTKHYCEDIFEVSPRKAVQGRHVAWAHFSPDCKHFSKAKGGKPASKKIRGLAWVVLRWAAEVRPDIISLENVEEFKTWGPLRNGRPIKSKAGQTFLQWKYQLEALGYEVEHRELVASDYGSPTSRKRLFVLARCDGKPIVWPQETHGDPESEAVKSGKLLPWRTAADVINWTLPAPSIFDSKEEIKKRYGLKAVRPLADNTQRRVIRGIDKFVLHSENPYVVPYSDSGTTTPNIVVVNHSGGFRGQAVTQPLQTVTGKHGYGIAQPALTPVFMANSEHAVGSAPERPLGTITPGGHHMMLAPALIQYHSEQSERIRGQSITEPLCTVDTANRYAVVAPVLTKYYGSDEHGQSANEPLHTITAKSREGIADVQMSPCEDEKLAAHITKYFSGGYKGVGNVINTPVPTITDVDHNAVVISSIVKMKGSNLGQSADKPLQTVTASGMHFGTVQTVIVKVQPGIELCHWPEVRKLLNHWCDYKMKDDEILLIALNGAWYYIADIGLRMLTPRELYAASGFPPDYIIDHDFEGRLYGKTKQVARCGNAVPPPFATAIVRANAPEYCEGTIWTMKELNERIAV